MKIIVGLGNPGEKYRNTRHNLGFELVDVLAQGKHFGVDSKLEAEICKDGNFVFVKPTTFMNESGRSVRKVMDFYKMSAKDVVLIHDDLDLKLGDYKVQDGVGPKVHNGVNSVEEALGTKDFRRVRLGIDNREKNDYSKSGADYVLEKFTKEEEEEVQDILEEVADELLVTLGL